MKKVIKIKDLCCQRCADFVAEKLALLDGVRAAKGSYKRNCIFIEVREDVSDESLIAALAEKEMEVLSIEKRKGIFG